MQTQISTHYTYVHKQRQSLGPFLKIDDAHYILWDDVLLNLIIEWRPSFALFDLIWDA